jgi:hypothetical protein
VKLDNKGRCCGRKPIVYKRNPHLFCCRCDRAFDLDGNQIENWAWQRVPSGPLKYFERRPKIKRTVLSFPGDPDLELK